MSFYSKSLGWRQRTPSSGQDLVPRLASQVVIVLLANEEGNEKESVDAAKYLGDVLGVLGGEGVIIGILGALARHDGAGERLADGNVQDVAVRDSELHQSTACARDSSCPSQVLLLRVLARLSEDLCDDHSRRNDEDGAGNEDGDSGGAEDILGCERVTDSHGGWCGKKGREERWKKREGGGTGWRKLQYAD